MDQPWNDSPGDGGETAEPREDLTADLLRLTAAIVTFVAAIALGAAG
jgi:hypothetical protein